MREVDVIIIGQGISGSWLGWWLQKKELSFLIIDQSRESSASAAAAGVINPVTGRRFVTTWLIDRLMPFAKEAYAEMSAFLQTGLISETELIDFFPSVQMLQAFQKRYGEDPQYLRLPEDGQAFRDYFNYDLGYGIIKPCLLVDTKKMLKRFREKMIGEEKLLDAFFDRGAMVRDGDFIHYADVRARYIVFCDGMRSATDPFFQNLPFAPNKGEVLLVEAPGLPREFIFKKGMSLVPWQDQLFWVGSSYEWEFTDALPSALFRQRTEGLLKEWLKIPFRVVDHLAALRPATLERRPFAGFHPLFPNVGLFNGMGTKGCSLAPYFAAQLAAKIKGEAAIDPAADIKRFDRILARPAL
jgi:glycine/D-amino acid oxidase-like deaminating enzyme